MDEKIREHLISRLIERMYRAIPGETREGLAERYLPAFRMMTDAELGGVWERTSASSDAQLYIIDESVHRHLSKRVRAPRLGSDVHLLFQTTIRH